MPLIHVLDETTINKIAAGEVVERPASVVKELVENAIDAGASLVETEIAEGGTAYMRITDDGCGMSEEDARLAVLRHATSKIRHVEDLFDIASLGFRGEALASIASVSKFALTTRRMSDDAATRVTVEGGTITDCGPSGGHPGTTVEVRELFYNTPARKKFLKTVRTEQSKIQDIVGKLAVANPHVSFRLISDGSMSIVTPGNGNLTDTLAALYGYKVTDDVFPVRYEAEGIVVSGAVGKPTLLKSSRTWQTLIVNDRIVSDRAVNKAIDNAYHALLPKGGYPLAVLRITVPADSVDINVHPRKSEVKFADDKPIFRAVYQAVLQALQRPSETAARASEDEFSSEQSVFGGKTIPADANAADRRDIVAGPNGELSPRAFDRIVTAVDYDKVFGGRRKGYEVVREETEAFVERIKRDGYRLPIRETYGQSDLALDTTGDAKETKAALPVPMGQVADCYILAKLNDDLYIIDQHAAHERIRYDALCKSAEAVPSQELLVPLYADVSEADIALAEEETETLENLGFSVSQGGPTQLRIDAVPSDLQETQAVEVLRFICSYLHDHRVPTKAQLRHEMLAYASCRGAIKAGHRLNVYQMSVLIDELFRTDKPFVCPHGRPTVVKFTPDELGKLFMRT